ncbi:motility protein A [Georgenia yuyongxinii]|uniref:Motility protein A n=1 Tax=Georgenia yuyongxinii TaxID=2589797 RepID=A0A552WSF0_9MICO|nr:motility protein A [Georgenia yuyongxinii]TRW45636.1 motility protein A [Georgenia yuyongxinii]
MDLATIVGLVVAFAAVWGAMTIEGTHVSSILLPGPIVIVFLGTIGAGLAGGMLKDAIHAVKQLPRAFVSKAPRQGATIPTVVRLSDRARREGLLALEDDAREIEDDFLRDGLTAAIDGADPEDLRALLEDRIDTKRRQDKVASGFFNSLGGYAPTIGIIGTVVSLVHVLENLTDPDSLGPLIAAAFVATLWGILSANMIWLPIASRLKRLSDLECAQMEVTLEGLIALQSGANPRMVNERLRSLVPASEIVEDEAA